MNTINNFTQISDYKKLDKGLINKRQVYMTPQKSNTFEKSTSKNEEKKGFFNKWGKVLTVVGAAVALVVGGVVAKKKIYTKKVKELEAEARRVAQEQVEKAKADAEKKAEEARIKAEKLAEERKNQLEERARIKAEQEAEAQRLAKIAEENAYKAKVDGILNSFGEQFSLGGNVKVTNDVAKQFETYTADEFLTGIVDTLKKAEQDGVKESNVAAMYSKIKEGIKTTQFEYSNSYEKVWWDFNLTHSINRRKNIISDLEALEQKVPQKEGESFGEYISRLAETKRSNAPKDSGVEKVRSMLRYSDSVEKTKSLTDEELKQLVEWKPDTYANLSKEEAQVQLYKDSRRWVLAYTDDMMNTSAYTGVEDIILSKGFPRYSSATRINSGDFEAEPLYRWISFPDGTYTIEKDGSFSYNSKFRTTDEFVRDFFRDGEEYTAPRLQSCSKDKHYAETEFNDWNSEKRVKLVIHPKSKVSKAADIGMGRYGENEVIYPAGTKFRVLDKQVDEVINSHYSENCVLNGPRVFSRWEIHLQEM